MNARSAVLHPLLVRGFSGCSFDAYSDPADFLQIAPNSLELQVDETRDIQATRYRDRNSGISDDPLEQTTEVTVVARTIVAVTVTPPIWATEPGRTKQFSLTQTFSNATMTDVTSAAEWDSAQPAVDTVDARGVVSALAPGNATVSATVTALAGQTAAAASVIVCPKLAGASYSGIGVLPDAAERSLPTEPVAFVLRPNEVATVIVEGGATFADSYEKSTTRHGATACLVDEDCPGNGCYTNVACAAPAGGNCSPPMCPHPDQSAQSWLANYVPKFGGTMCIYDDCDTVIHGVGGAALPGADNPAVSSMSPIHMLVPEDVSTNQTDITITQVPFDATACPATPSPTDLQYATTMPAVTPATGRPIILFGGAAGSQSKILWTGTCGSIIFGRYGGGTDSSMYFVEDPVLCSAWNTTDASKRPPVWPACP